MAPKSTWETFTFVSGIGFHFVITIGVCIFLGQKADIYFDSTPIFTLISSVITAVTLQKIKDVNKF